MRYRGRFAPSPTGQLHAGSLVAALASWLDARAHGGAWLVRIEDVDTPRCIPGAGDEILRQLAACGLIPDEPPLYQSQRGDAYQAALNRLIKEKAAYPCGCSRQDIEAVLKAQGHIKQRHAELVYPNTCRTGLHGKSARAWRFLTSFFISNQPLSQSNHAANAMNLIPTSLTTISWLDRRLGIQQQNVEQEVGDFVLRRADGLWAYQLAVVVDDAVQGITHIVRGEDLADNTARQILLQRALTYARPHYLHTPLVLGSDGHKLSKQNSAAPLALRNEQEAAQALAEAASILGLHRAALEPVHSALAHYVSQWLQAHPNH
jgi:glutamyl-Q tRNA(Asp) synthetase